LPSPDVIYSEVAEAQVDDAYEWLSRFDFDAAERWLNGFTAAVIREAEMTLGVIPSRRSVAFESVEFARTVYSFNYRTSRAGSPWRVLYELLDEDGDGRLDTLRVVRVRHAASVGASPPPAE
jgi:plasmid stabilization system protein ParE